ncbi:hypothetical protein BP6252_11202 [Coleophoma cylindrospora]|uniref:Uncharacterized protein n=1 Tax=Coleophoma cylindrospora TaxID=1849047 RepID=A0A3D8QPE0_9HELO|nr:hypothetical protein BP6252_11202 [Coleophoma cylindrospora]
MEIPAETQERIHNAVERYRHQMLSSNRRYLADCISLVQTLGLSPEMSLKKLGAGLHLIRDTEWFKSLQQLPSPEAVISGEENITMEESIGDIEYCPFVGIWPAAEEEIQQECIEGLTEQINDSLDPNGEITRVELPIEFVAMIKEADHIMNPDLVEWGDVGIRGTSSWQDPDHQFPNYSDLETLLQMHTYWSLNLEVLTGWALDETESVDEVYSSSYYAYCRHTESESDEPVSGTKGEWGWRIIVARDAEGDGEGGELVFESLEEYLDSISCWYDRVQRDFKEEAAKQLKHPNYIQGIDGGESWHKED